MEYDRYQQNSKLFVIGIICLLLSLALFAFGFYILPYIVWNWHYDVPGFVLTWREWFKEEYNYSEKGAALLVFSLFIMPAIACGYISQRISNYIDNQIYGIGSPETPTEEVEEEVEGKDAHFGLKFGLKIALLIILVLIAVTFFEWLLIGPT